jgi:hypothetical protein
MSTLLNHDWVKIGAVILSIFASVATAEHRITNVENRTTELARIVETLQIRQDRAEERQYRISETQARISTILEGIEKRLDREDNSKSNKNWR